MLGFGAFHIRGLMVASIYCYIQLRYIENLWFQGFFVIIFRISWPIYMYFVYDFILWSLFVSCSHCMCISDHVSFHFSLSDFYYRERSFYDIWSTLETRWQVGSFCRTRGSYSRENGSRLQTLIINVIRLNFATNIYPICAILYSSQSKFNLCAQGPC